MATSVRQSAFAKNFKKTGQISFKGSGRTAAYRGAARKAMKGGSTPMQANRAGNKADQAYSG